MKSMIYFGRCSAPFKRSAVVRVVIADELNTRARPLIWRCFSSCDSGYWIVMMKLEYAMPNDNYGLKSMEGVDEVERVICFDINL